MDQLHPHSLREESKPRKSLELRLPRKPGGYRVKVNGFRGRYSLAGGVGCSWECGSMYRAGYSISVDGTEDKQELLEYKPGFSEERDSYRERNSYPPIDPQKYGPFLSIWIGKRVHRGDDEGN